MDYRLIPPATGHDIVEDIIDLMGFLGRADGLSNALREAADSQPSGIELPFKINPEALAIAGSSSGGLCAYLAAMHCVSPKPKAILSMYGMGGDFLVRVLIPRSEMASYFETMNVADSPLPNPQNGGILPWSGTAGPCRIHEISPSLPLR